jgi:WD40 repeat protein
VNHPTVDQIVAGEPSVKSHLATCESCRQLAAVLVVPSSEGTPTSPGGLPREASDLPDLPLVDEASYGDWRELAQRGGMGQVFRVRDRRLGRWVALKQPQKRRGGESGGQDDVLVRRFEREALLTARLQHPSIVGVYEAGRFSDGRPFYAMPLLRGVPLSQEIGKRKDLAARLGLLSHVTAVAEAVAFAHQQGILHRDVKPDNVLVGTFGETVLVDWGLAKDLSQGAEPELPTPEPLEDGLTLYGVGTPQYMPPEQASGAAPDVRVDVYALGATLYHTLSGEPPYGHGKAHEVRLRLEQGPPRPLLELAPEVPGELAGICAKAMERDPAKRFATAQELADELRRFQTGQLLQSRRYTPVELWRHYVKRNRVPLRIAAIAVVLLLLGAAAAFLRISRERDLAQKSQHQAEHELRRSEGVVASRLAPDPLRRLEALRLAVGAVAPELRDGEPPAPEAFQGLLDVLTAGPLGRPLRHQGAVVRYATTRDGKLLLAIDDAKQVLVYDARSGERLQLWHTTLPEPQQLAASPDGRFAVVCGFDPAFEVFDLQTGRRLREDTKNDVSVCDFLADGRVLIGAEDVTVRDPATLAVERRLPSATPISSVAHRPGGELAVGSFDGKVLLWPAQGQPRTLRAEGPLPRQLKFDPGGRSLLVFDADQGIRQFSLTEIPAPAPRLLHRTEEGNSFGLFTSPDGRFLAAPRFELDGSHHTTLLGGPDSPARAPREVRGMAIAWSPDPRWFLADDKGPLWLVDAESGGTVLALPAHTDEVLAHFAGSMLATASRDGVATLWDLTPGEETGMLLGHTGEIRTLVSFEAKPEQVVATSLDGRASTFRIADGHGSFSDSGSELLAAASEQGVRLSALGGLDGSLRPYAGQQQRLALPVHLGPVAVVAAGRRLAPAREQDPEPRARILFAAGSLDGRLLLLRHEDLEAPAEPGSSKRGIELESKAGAVTALSFSADDSKLASAHADGSTHLWDLVTATHLASLPDTEPTDEPGDHDGHSHLAFAGDALLAGRPLGHTLVLDARTLAPRGKLDGRLLASGAAALSPDGARVVTGNGEGVVFVHPVPGPAGAGQAALRLEGHRAAVLSAAFSPSGKRLVTGAIDGSVRVWDLTTGRAAAAIHTPDLGPATAVAMPDDDHALAGHASGALRLHPASPAAALQRACALLRRFAQAEGAGPDCAGR